MIGVIALGVFLIIAALLIAVLCCGVSLSGVGVISSKMKRSDKQIVDMSEDTEDPEVPPIEDDLVKD